MQLPEESITYQYENLLIPTSTDWSPTSELQTQQFLHPDRLRDIQPQLQQAKSQVIAEREMRSNLGNSGPIEAGFIDLPQNLLTEHRRKGDHSELGRLVTIATHLASQADRILFLSMGETSLPGRMFFETLCSGYHNEIPSDNRLGKPRVYFEGDHADNDALQELLDLNQFLCIDPEHREERWAVVPISKNELPIEMATALRVLYRDARDYYGMRSEWVKHLFIPVAGENGPLRGMYVKEGYTDEDILTIPENVGARFCALTAAGLFPAAVMGLDVRAVLQGAASMTRRFVEDPFERNPVLQHAAVNYLMTTECQKPIRLLNTWSRKMQSLGEWYVQLVSESLCQRGKGPIPVASASTNSLYFRGRQFQEGPREQFLTNVVVRAPRQIQIDIQMSDNNADSLNTYARKGLPDILSASCKGLSQSQYETARPSANLLVPTLNEHTLGQLIQMLMLSTVVEARLMGLNPYTSGNSRNYQQHMWEELKRTDDQAP